jgi:hypothetical protein
VAQVAERQLAALRRGMQAEEESIAQWDNEQWDNEQ